MEKIIEEQVIEMMVYLLEHTKKIAYFLGSTEKQIKTANNVRLEFKNGSGDCYNPYLNIIEFGKKDFYKFNTKYLRKCLVHEFLHSIGLRHNDKMRNVGYYSSIRRDRFTNIIMEMIGWEAPSEQDYVDMSNKRREKRLEYINNAKYIIFCPNCEFKVYRKIKCKLVNYPQKYWCPRCKSKLESKEMEQQLKN